MTTPFLSVDAVEPRHPVTRRVNPCMQCGINGSVSRTSQRARLARIVLDPVRNEAVVPFRSGRMHDYFKDRRGRAKARALPEEFTLTGDSGVPSGGAFEDRTRTFLSFPRSAWECLSGRSASRQSKRRGASQTAFPRGAWERDQSIAIRSFILNLSGGFRRGGFQGAFERLAEGLLIKHHPIGAGGRFRPELEPGFEQRIAIGGL